jgi:hypothetical protein
VLCRAPPLIRSIKHLQQPTAHTKITQSKPTKSTQLSSQTQNSRQAKPPKSLLISKGYQRSFKSSRYAAIQLRKRARQLGTSFGKYIFAVVGAITISLKHGARWTGRLARTQLRLVAISIHRTARALWQDMRAAVPIIIRTSKQAFAGLLASIQRLYDAAERVWLWFRTND